MMNWPPPLTGQIECDYAASIEWILYNLYQVEGQTTPRLGGTKAKATIEAFKFREETFTEAIVATSTLQFPGVIANAYTTTREGSVSGADWLCCVRTGNLSANLLIQAKRPNTQIVGHSNYSFDLDSKAKKATQNRPARPAWYQKNTLLKHAKALGAVPFYGLYAPGCSQNGCTDVPWTCSTDRSKAYGTLHLVDPSLVTNDPYKVSGPFPGITLSTLLCCRAVLSTLGDLKDTQMTNEQIVELVSKLAEIGEAPKVVTTLDFSLRSRE